MSNINRTKVVSIIPARGGSKAIPKKNLMDFCGKPLIAWSIEQALGAASVDSVWVTSDSQEILSVAVQHGARAILRPDALATDTATSESAWLHAIEVIEAEQGPVDLVVALQATSPLRTAQDIDNAVKTVRENDCDSLFSGAVLSDFLIWKKAADGQLSSMNYDYKNRSRRQDRSEEYVENGSIYVFKPQVIKTHQNRLGGRMGISLMEFWKSFEIDEPEDAQLCAYIMKNKLLANQH